MYLELGHWEDAISVAEATVSCDDIMSYDTVSITGTSELGDPQDVISSMVTGHRAGGESGRDEGERGGPPCGHWSLPQSRPTGQDCQTSVAAPGKVAEITIL